MAFNEPIERIENRARTAMLARQHLVASDRPLQEDFGVAGRTKRQSKLQSSALSEHDRSAAERRLGNRLEPTRQHVCRLGTAASASGYDQRVVGMLGYRGNVSL